MILTLAILGMIMALAGFEYRIKRPDQIVLYEARGQILPRKGRFYPRHFSLALPATIKSFALTVEAEAKGRLKVLIRLSVTAAVSLAHLGSLVRAGGWNKDAFASSCKELEGTVQGYARDFAEKSEIEELASEKIRDLLTKKAEGMSEALGLDIISLSVLSIDPVDKEIAEAMRQQEAARILEATETANQKARMAAAQIKFRSDEGIALLEHDLEMKRCDLKREKEEKEAILARQRLDEELRHREKQLELDKKEMDLLKDSPELLMLSPQMARLAEASQNLKNARTVVSFTPDPFDPGAPFAGILQSNVQRLARPAAATAATKTEDGK
jgi:hypothetical protein